MCHNNISFFEIVSSTEKITEYCTKWSVCVWRHLGIWSVFLISLSNSSWLLLYWLFFENCLFVIMPPNNTGRAQFLSYLFLHESHFERKEKTTRTNWIKNSRRVFSLQTFFSLVCTCILTLSQDLFNLVCLAANISFFFACRKTLTISKNKINQDDELLHSKLFGVLLSRMHYYGFFWFGRYLCWQTNVSLLDEIGPMCIQVKNKKLAHKYSKVLQQQWWCFDLNCVRTCASYLIVAGILLDEEKQSFMM